MARSALFTVILLAASGMAYAGDPLYARLGGGEKIQAVVNDAVESATQSGGAIAGDPKVAKQALAQYICARSGGGCASKGGGTEFLSLVEPLRIALRAHQVPLAARNELLEILAAARRDVAQR